MRFIFAIGLVLLSIVGAQAHEVHTSTCNTLAGARELHGTRVEMRYTARAHGHKGEHCWFAASKGYDPNEPQVGDHEHHSVELVTVAVLPKGRPFVAASHVTDRLDVLFHTDAEEQFNDYASGFYRRTAAVTAGF